MYDAWVVFKHGSLEPVVVCYTHYQASKEICNITDEYVENQTDYYICSCRSVGLKGEQESSGMYD